MKSRFLAGLLGLYLEGPMPYRKYREKNTKQNIVKRLKYFKKK
ncbi:hypothetical protein bcere0013_35930 [Bacillus cereus BDRD-ST26]|nr:hypothetical protein bcere0013_35930 [Bacillus cereus BDRD-ST26]